MDKAFRDLDKKSDAVITAVSNVVEQVAKDIELKASQDAPAYPPQIPELKLNIGQRIEAKPTEFIRGKAVAFEIFVRTNPDDELTFFDGYMEFNTGLQASQLLSGPNYSEEIKALAIKYLGKKMPYTGTLRGKPYFYPNVFRFTANFQQDIKKAIKNNIK